MNTRNETLLLKLIDDLDRTPFGDLAHAFDRISDAARAVVRAAEEFRSDVNDFIVNHDNDLGPDIGRLRASLAIASRVSS